MTCADVMAADAWYVVQTKPRQECVARENLSRQGFQCLLPLLKVERIRRAMRTWAEEPLFARYLFVAPCGAQARWGAIRSTRGVSRLVAFGGRPARLPPGWIKEFKVAKHPARRLFARGEPVVVRHGPLSGIEGIYEMPDGEDRAVVMLEILVRACKTSLMHSSLQAA